MYTYVNTHISPHTKTRYTIILNSEYNIIGIFVYYPNNVPREHNALNFKSVTTYLNNILRFDNIEMSPEYF